MLQHHFWGAQNDVSACVQHRVVGAAPPSDSALAAGEASPIATGVLPAAPVSSAESVPAGSASAAAEVVPAVADDVPVFSLNCFVYSKTSALALNQFEPDTTARG